ncbi:uncharacterized protein J4E88_009263 [Alternaria novae-zelandiae]|uniref:uncharacterized protein n=1 Tax=Alternaria novae-zelandiae TaxID=430562 RepID=UPI0020C1E157|nr:uncharacterized protein J4E88_009263 [Alternaria novae-zelandiae]KAI4671230.1 hypothetical protein J4E88_009263 [Alternaria novae-zelandiae]
MAGDTSTDKEAYALFPYEPSKVGAILFAVLFGLSTIYHLFQMIRGRAWFYTAFVIGSIMMTIGYAARYLSAQSPSELMPYIMQSLFIILPPSLYAATIYMIYGRLVVFVNAEHASVIRPTLVTKIFVCGDVVAFLMQSGGGGMMAQADMADMGQKIMLLGLFVQLAFFGFFVVVSAIFYFRMRSAPERYTVPKYGKYAWPTLYKLLAIAAVVIIARCIFRVIEFGQGHSGYLASHEVYMYVFDTLPMFLVQVLFHFVRADDVFGTNHRQVKKLDSEIIGLYERA